MKEDERRGERRNENDVDLNRKGAPGIGGKMMGGNTAEGNDTGQIRIRKNDIREISLQQYYPVFVQNLYEFQTMADAENQEFNSLVSESDDRFHDSFIMNASLRGLKRYEEMLGMASVSRIFQEERRQNVLMKWNRQLPYTMRRLLEQLKLWAGEDGFSVGTGQLTEYILDVCLKDKGRTLLRNVKDSVDQMIPANLILRFSGLYPFSLEIPVRYENRLTLGTGFYPRYNMAYHYLEDAHCLDGTKVLNGYDADITVDFYPVGQRISGSVQQETGEESAVRAGGTVRNDAGILTRLAAGLEAAEHPEGSLAAGFLTSFSDTPDCTSQSVFLTEAEWNLESDSTSVKLRQSARTKEDIFTGSELRFTFGYSASVETAGSLFAEDSMRYLNGKGYLDGSGLLNADTYTYKL